MTEDTVQVHRVTTAAFLKALGGPNERRYRNRVFKNTMAMMLALLRLRGGLATSLEMMAEYAYGWDENGGPSAPRKCLGVLVCRARKKGHIPPVTNAGGYMRMGKAGV